MKNNIKKTIKEGAHKAKKNVVVTGGAGFIGHHLVNELVHRGYEVFVIDNLVTGKKEDVHKDAHIHVVDIGNLDLLKKTFEIIGSIDYVFHLACRPRVQFSIDFPDQTNDTNITGTLNVLIAAIMYFANFLRVNTLLKVPS